MSTTKIHPRRLLLVDDNRGATLGLSKLLAGFGHCVQCISDPDLIQSAVDQYKPDAIFLDLAMPHMNGFEAAAMLRARGYRGPLIAMTGYSDDEHRNAAASAGISYYLVKPADVNEVQRILSALPTWVEEANTERE